MKILLLGAQGQLGTDFIQVLQREQIGQWLGVNRTRCDVTHTQSLIHLILEYQPTVLINATAFTQVEKASTQWSQAYAVNAQAPLVMAQCMRQLGGLYLHFSTDYVFGEKGVTPLAETQPHFPLNAYGLSKSLGEENIVLSGTRYFIFRLAWLYSRHHPSFLSHCLRLFEEKKDMQVVCDQVGTPTPSWWVAEQCISILKQYKQMGDCPSGIYHLAPSGQCSWYEFAKAIHHHSKATSDLKAITSEQWISAVKRPSYSVLNTQKLQQTWGLHIPTWETLLEQTLTS